MHLAARHEFDASCAEVYAMITDPAFLTQAARDLGSTATTVAVEGAVTRISATVPTPGAIATFAGHTVTVGQELTWGPEATDGSRTAELIIKLAGLPAMVTATARLHPVGTGSAIDYVGALTVSVPLLGPTLEKQAAPFVYETLAIQQRSGQDWLARR